MSRLITGAGTTESGWASSCLDDLPDVSLDAPHVVVVAPHPDDEVLGVGGTIATLERRGAAIEIVALTDGERGAAAGIACPELGGVRRLETATALELLLGRIPPIHHIGLPDGRIGAHRAEATAAIAAVLRPESLCLAPHRDDGHPDHEAAWSAAGEACSIVGCAMLEYPVWLWHWAVPADLVQERERYAKVALPGWAVESKRRAIGAFTSQTSNERGAAILPPHVLERFTRPYEVLAR